MADSERSDLSHRLSELGWNVDGWEAAPDGVGVKVGLRVAPATSGEPARYISGTDVDDALRKELDRL
jgi:hypothetical protein